MKTRALGVAAAIASLALLAGCSGASSSSLPDGPVAGDGQIEAPSDTGAGYADKGLPEGRPADIPGASTGQKLARTARVNITVTDVEAAADQLRTVATSLDGQVTSENLVVRTGADGKPAPASTMVISVPGDRLDSALDQLKSLGAVTSRVVSSEDVTLQVTDIESRIRTANDSIGRLRELWKRAGSVSELTALESEISSRISERDSMVAQQQVLARRVALSPITVTFSTPAQAPPAVETPGFLGGLLAGWNALVASTRVVMTVVGALLPFVAVIVVIGLPLLFWRRRMLRASEPASSAPNGPAPEKSSTTSQ